MAGGTTTKRSEDEIRKLMESLGGQTNAYTSDEVTAFYIDCPSKGVDVAINLIAENMQFSIIPEKSSAARWGLSCGNWRWVRAIATGCFTTP